MTKWVRSEGLSQVSQSAQWDVIVIGGGATGLGIALDSASRGYQTLLLERYDFTQGTSSRSTKLVHGGVRYLRQGQISLVFEALRERGRLRANAPHLVRVLPFVITARRWWERWFYKVGLSLYDLLSGRYRFGKNRTLTSRELASEVSTLRDGLRGGVMFYDGQMDDARLGLALAKTAVDHGATVLNYCEVTQLHYSESGRITGLTFKDHLVMSDMDTNADSKLDHATSEAALGHMRVEAKVIINATGVFTDRVRSLENAQLNALIRPSQGAHVVLPKRFLPEDNGVVFPETPDGRVLFAVPWYERVLVGTTDVYRGEVDDEPAPLQEEVDFILELAQANFKEPPQKSDILSVFAGLRPLVAPADDSERKTSKISREHDIRIGAGGVFHITGGKWTTYRKMAEDMITAVIKEGLLPRRDCVTAELKLAGWTPSEGALNVESVYGSDISEIRAMCQEDDQLSQPIHPRLPYLRAHVVFAARHELAMTIADVLSRRTRALLLDARSALEAAPEVARILAHELNRDQRWVEQQIDDFTTLAQRYIWPES